MNSNYYILKDKIPVEEKDIIKWGKLMEGNRKVKRTEIGDVSVSTVFLGLDHQWGKGPPLLFETMIFGGKLDQEQDRYSTWDQAVEGHNKMVGMVVASEVETVEQGKK